MTGGGNMEGVGMMDILDRLKENRCPENSGCNVLPSCACGDMEDAAEEIARLRAEVERLWEALGQIDYHADNQDMNHEDFRIKAAQCVRAALNGEAQ